MDGRHTTTNERDLFPSQQLISIETPSGNSTSSASSASGENFYINRVDYFLCPPKAKVSIASTLIQDGLPSVSIEPTSKQLASASADLETNGILNSIFLSHVAGEVRGKERGMIGSNLTLSDQCSRPPSVFLNPTDQPSPVIAPCKTPCGMVMSFPTNRPQDSDSVEFDLERLIGDIDSSDDDTSRSKAHRNDSRIRLNEHHAGDSAISFSTSEGNSDLAKSSYSIMVNPIKESPNVNTTEELLISHLANSRCVALPDLDHMQISDSILSSSLPPEKAVNSKPSSAITALLGKPNDSVVPTTTSFSGTCSPVKSSPVVISNHALAVVSHSPTMSKHHVDPTRNRTAISHPYEDALLVQEYRQQQLLNLQLRMAAMGATSTFHSQDIAYATSMRTTTAEAKTFTTEPTTELFLGLRDVLPYPAIPRSLLPSKQTVASVYKVRHVKPHHGRAPTDKMTQFAKGVADEVVRSNAYKDQAGCRVLQKKLEEGDPVDIEQIFLECLDQLNVLMTDPFGNYLCQKLIEVINDEQLGQLLDRIASDIPFISLNMHGTRATQALVKQVSKTERVHAVIDALRGHVVSLVKDLNGNHVIQKCLTTLSNPLNQFIYDDLIENCVEVALHRHGCCVLQRSIDSATVEQRDRVIEAIRRNTLQLVQDAFGNYVVQYVLDLKQEKINDSITEMLLGNVTELSKQKFASNVVEKCLILGSEQAKSRLVGELLDGPHRVRDLLQDPFGNYVVQRVLHISKEPQFGQLIEVIREVLPQLRQAPSGKRIASKLTKKYPVLAQLSPEVPYDFRSTNIAQLQQLSGGAEWVAGLVPAPPEATLLTTAPYFGLSTALRTANLNSIASGLIPPFFPGKTAAFCSPTALHSHQSRPAEFANHRPLDRSSFPVRVSSPLGSVILNSPSFHHKFSRLQQLPGTAFDTATPTECKYIIE